MTQTQSSAADDNAISVFLSRPTEGSPAQMRFCQGLVNRVEEHGFNVRSLGTSDFGNDAPLITVQTLMSHCRGAVILGLSQLHARSCVRKPGSPSETAVGDLNLPTAWNHLEAGMAYMGRLPLLVVKEEGVATEGIFDPAVSEYYVHQAQLSTEWLRSLQFTQPFEQWAAEVRAASSA